jgi:hypothetical protein
MAAIALIGPPSLSAAPTTITDLTASTAVVNGTVVAGEYAGFSSGINAGFGDVIGANSQLHVDSDATGALNFGLITGGGGLNDRIVIYIDSQPGGFADTSPFADYADGLRTAVSASNGNGRADITFAPGFEADYAIGIESGFAGLFGLASGGNGSLNFVSGGAPLTTTLNHWEFAFLLSDMGLNPGESFSYVATYGNPFDSAGFFRSDEFHGVAGGTVPAGNIGVNPTTLATGDFNVFNSFAPVVPAETSTWGRIKQLY